METLQVVYDAALLAVDGLRPENSPLFPSSFHFDVVVKASRTSQGVLAWRSAKGVWHETRVFKGAHQWSPLIGETMRFFELLS